MRGIALATALMAATASTTSAFGFNAEGFQTGMTVDQVAAAVGGRGMTLLPPYLKSELSASFAVRVDRSGNVEASDPIINVLFCDGRLVGFSHNIDLDTDYIPALKDILDQHGSPGHVTVRTQPWSGQGGGYLSSSEMHWYFGDDRIAFSFTPEGRTGAGALRFSRTTSISYQTLTKQCAFGDW
jgi:hypothetical protein